VDRKSFDFKKGKTSLEEKSTGKAKRWGRNGQNQTPAESDQAPYSQVWRIYLNEYRPLWQATWQKTRAQVLRPAP